MVNFELQQKNELLQIAKTICPGFTLDTYNRQIVTDLFNYFTQRPGNLDLTKGLWLEGPTGTGKTTLLRIFSRYLINMRKGFLLHNCSDIATKYANGEDNLDAYTYGQYSIPNRPVTTAFDELGREPIPVYRYKTSLNVMQYILQIRYNLWQKQQIKTYVTTNCDADEIQTKYSDFIRDRRREIFNIIPLVGPSRR